ncbi:hypothetical protein D3C85_1262120 [compost metagenome]
MVSFFCFPIKDPKSKLIPAFTISVTPPDTTAGIPLVSILITGDAPSEGCTFPLIQLSAPFPANLAALLTRSWAPFLEPILTIVPEEDSAMSPVKETLEILLL